MRLLMPQINIGLDTTAICHGLSGYEQNYLLNGWHGYIYLALSEFRPCSIRFPTWLLPKFLLHF